MSVLGFELEWVDTVSGQLQTLFLKYFLEDKTIEILQAPKAFLKRIYYPQVTVDDLFVGNSITIYNRIMVIKNYANIATEKYFAEREIHVLCVLPSAARLAAVLQIANKHALAIGRVATTSVAVSTDRVKATEGSILLELVGSSGAQQFAAFSRELEVAASSIAANVLPVPAIKEALSQSRPVHIGSHECTLCLVKPHVLRDRRSGDLFQCIQASGFTARAVVSIHLTQTMAEEMFDVYRSLVPSFGAMMEELCSGPTLALLIEHSDASRDRPRGVVEDFREFAGPLQPELARAVRPKSLRALFGKSNACNAVHCTDLTEDGQSECRYIFETVAAL